jgi:hypothetical protein
VESGESPSPSPSKRKSSPRTNQPHKLVWKLSLDVMSMCFKAYEAFKEQILANETSTFVFDRFGGQFIKDSGFSPGNLIEIFI